MMTPAPVVDFAVKEWDILFGVVLLVVLVAGPILNILSLCYFITEYRNSFNKASLKDQGSKKRLFYGLFIITSITDLCICVVMLPAVYSFLNDREEGMFESEIICYSWGLFWTVLPYMSIFLVAVMSFHRTFTLIRPLHNFNPNILFCVVFTYFVYLVLWGVLPVILAEAKYRFYDDQMMCIEDSVSVNWYWKFKVITNQIQLVLPFFPITLSCLISFYALRRKTSTRARMQMMQREATKTILIITIIYWACNVPLVANYIYYTMMIVQHEHYNTMYRTILLYWYSWPISFIGCVGCNSLLNPLVYFFRMTPFRKFVKGQTKRFLCSRRIKELVLTTTPPSNGTRELDTVTTARPSPTITQSNHVALTS